MYFYKTCRSRGADSDFKSKYYHLIYIFLALSTSMSDVSVDVVSPFSTRFSLSALSVDPGAEARGRRCLEAWQSCGGTQYSEFWSKYIYA